MVTERFSPEVNEVFQWVSIIMLWLSILLRK